MEGIGYCFGSGFGLLILELLYYLLLNLATPKVFIGLGSFDCAGYVKSSLKFGSLTFFIWVIVHFLVLVEVFIFLDDRIL